MIFLVIICWLIPIAAVSVIFGTLLSRNYMESQQSAIETTVQNALRELEIRMNAAVEDSKDVSYDGIVRSSYRTYQLDEDSAALYSRVNEYLSQRFSRDEKYKGVFISFRNDIDISSHVISPGFPEYATVRNYRQTAEPLIMAEMAAEDTAIRFFSIDNELYMARNLLDGKFIPYATVVMQGNENILFSSFEDLPQGVILEIDIDGEKLAYGETPEPDSDYNFQQFSGDFAGHTVTVTSAFGKFHVWRDVPSLKYGIAGAIALGIPMILIAVILFVRQIQKPTGVLLDATEHVTAGERGYQITQIPENLEFRQLTERFNTMSVEMKNQFEQLYQEQQALQQAKIKALQSQINPHFLNNTLEVINWEARMAENEKVSAMIEALSTMLDGPLDRDSRGMIPLKQEISYVDAYLYIIHERLGESFHAEKEIEPGMEDVIVPRLILQPIVENAVEHDINPQGGGSLCVKVCRHAQNIVLETTHTGQLTEKDRAVIEGIMENAPSGDEPTIGLKNVIQRLRLIYGSSASFSCEEADGLIRMKFSFPEISEQQSPVMFRKIDR